MKEEFKNIKELIKNNDYISFDIFDTLILRNIEKPTDIFRVLAREVDEEYKIKTFFNDRIQAEQLSRVDQPNFESNLDRIYDFLDNKYSKIKNKIKRREQDLEYEFIVPNQFMKSVYDYCITENKKVILISDMYLPKAFLLNILKKCGYVNVNMYLSNEELESKHIGGLFDLVMQKEKLKPNKWLHIGDNPHSDIEIPKSKGINTYYYKNVYERINRKTTDSSIELAILRGIQNNYLLNNELDYWGEFGVKYISSIYYGFTNWLYNLTKKEEIIYFLSRDGYIIKKLYEIFKRNFNTNTELKYLYTSRVACQIPNKIIKNKNEAIITMTERNVAFGHKLTLKEIFEIIMLNPENYKFELELFGYKYKDIDKEIKDEELYNLRKFISYIYDDIEEVFKVKYDLLKEYLEQEGIKENKKVSLVDIGWRGSIQKTIDEVTKSKTRGYYFGTNISIYDTLKMNSFGYVSDCGNGGEVAQFIFDNLMMFEMIFSAPEGTLLGFKKEKNKIVPVLDKKNMIEKNIEIFQESAIKIIEEYIKYNKYLSNLKIENVIVDYRDFINYKEFKDLIKFKNLDNDVGYSTQKKNYVNTFEKEYVLNNFDEFQTQISYSLWKNSFLIDDISSEEELEEFKNIISDYNLSRKYRFRNLKSIKKAIKNPKKAWRVIKIKLKKNK